MPTRLAWRRVQKVLIVQKNPILMAFHVILIFLNFELFKNNGLTNTKTQNKNQKDTFVRNFKSYFVKKS
jgi:hypothetical protein